ncbi:MAG: YbhB/YbcL family Raf kinase inhibitor-like protein [Propionibacteriaceae bacterium]|jgi:Raf kinase inhibitor-like YbhB/YbcL family protein|nr:YbhB/YbcL family Raf kinase inhibitor-like protein [Propionibacteriaceae bacterium]
MSFDPNRPQVPDPYASLPPVPAFPLVSPQIVAGEPLPFALSGDGGAHSPELSWTGAPAETASLLLTCFDPDAPMPGGYWHWLVVDVPAGTVGVAYDAGQVSGAGLDGAYSTPNSSGRVSYVGSAPPVGDQYHRYFFVVHALDVEHLALPRGAESSPVEVAEAALPHTIARAVLMGTYQR